MSAWYIFTSLGFYPVAPGSDIYYTGSPNIVSADIHLENGKIFKIRTENQSEKSLYVKKIILNGKELKENKITHSDIVNGGELKFVMTKKAGK
jgi:putative alpha-1,2-mannosidase